MKKLFLVFKEKESPFVHLVCLFQYRAVFKNFLITFKNFLIVPTDAIGISVDSLIVSFSLRQVKF